MFFLLLALEDSERRLQERMLLQGWTANEAANLDVLTLDTFRSRIGPLQNGYPKLLDMVQMGNYKLVIIDTISRAFMGLRDINDSQEVTAALSPLQELAIGNDFAILGIDHHAKPKGTNPNPIDDLMGATAKSAVADTLIGVYRDPQQKSNLRLLAEGRDVEPIDLTLRFDRLTGCWQCEGETETFIQSEREREVRDALRQLGGSGTLKDICEAIDQPKSHTSSRLTALASRGMVEKISDAAGKTLLYRLIEGVE